MPLSTANILDLLARKMTIFCATFEANSIIGKLWDLLEYFNQKKICFKMNKIQFCYITNV